MSGLTDSYGRLPSRQHPDRGGGSVATRTEQPRSCGARMESQGEMEATDLEVAECTCPHLALGTKVLEQKNWNPDCEEHGTDSVWYTSEAETQRRLLQNERLRGMYDIKKRRASGEISIEQARIEVAELEQKTTYKESPT